MTITRQCIECGEQFSISDRGQKFFAEHGFVLPRRCLPCRRAMRVRKAQQLPPQKEEPR